MLLAQFPDGLRADSFSRLLCLGWKAEKHGNKQAYHQYIFCFHRYCFLVVLVSKFHTERECASHRILHSVPSATLGVENTTPVTKTRLIDTPVRSGQRIYAPQCDLIVTSHVSAGAELIADGNIHVYGMMRGRALAGASGDRETQIFCTNLMAELVSIAGEYWLSDQIPAEFYGKAARLQLVENALTVQPLN